MLWNRILYFLSGFLKAKAIKGPRGEPYLERYMLGRFRGSAIFLHRFLASDPDRGLHDHPWGVSASLIVGGGYKEKRLMMKQGRPWMTLRTMRPGRINLIRGNDFHQVVLEPGRPAWTIFCHGPRVKPWGFVPSSEGLAPKEEGFFEKGSYELFLDDKPETPWEKSAPRGRELAGRMPVDYSYGAR